MQSLVCETCWTEVFDTEAIQKFWAQETSDFCYTTTWTRIFTSANSGCNWCAFLASTLPSPDTPQWPSNWTPTTDLLVMLEQAYLMEDCGPQGLNLCQIDFSSEAPSRDWHIELDLFVDDTDTSAGIVTARPLQSKVDSAEAYSQIKKWLDHCKHHVECGEMPMYASLPSRVIEVAPAGSLGVPRLRNTTGMTGLYLALSYCWGSDQSYVLTTNNIDVLMAGLEVRMLPQTILDAIEVTKALGFEYLWVDALCIMQDVAKAAAREDMNQELANMDQVYKNATMIIVAACAPSVKDGFLKDRPGSGQSRFDVPIRLSPNQFFVVHTEEHIVYDDKSEPVNQRAWTLQEQLLSPRLLIYASHTLQWQCRTLTCNLGGSYHQSNPSAVPRMLSMQNLILNDSQQKKEGRQLGSDLPHSILQHWLRIVTHYSLRKSSLPSDKLPALSALAVSYASIFGPGYLAGIWSRSAVQQLCWRNPDSRLFFTRPPKYRAPSWSWAALDGPIYFPSFLMTDNASVCVPYHHFQIIDWQTHPRSINLPYGEVTAGKLIVTTISRAGTFDPSHSPTIRFTAAISLADTALLQTAQGLADTVEDNFTRSVWCLAMYHMDGAESLRIGGLMLVESSEHGGHFRRMGSYSADISVFEDYPVDTISII